MRIGSRLLWVLFITSTCRLRVLCLEVGYKLPGRSTYECFGGIRGILLFNGLEEENNSSLQRRSKSRRGTRAAVVYRADIIEERIPCFREDRWSTHSYVWAQKKRDYNKSDDSLECNYSASSCTGRIVRWAMSPWATIAGMTSSDGAKYVDTW